MARHEWTIKEIDYLKEIYPTVDGNLIAEKLGLTYCQVVYKARSLGIRKDYSFLVEASKRLKEASIGTRFKKGMIPKNKGLKQVDYMNAETIEKTAKTRFKKGMIPHNALPVGTEVLRYDKRYNKTYSLIKVEGCKKLVFKQIQIYETHHKVKLKPGENIIFKDRNTDNFSIDNLECVTDVELMKRNTIRRYPEELRTKMIKISKLKRIIKKLENGKN